MTPVCFSGGQSPMPKLQETMRVPSFSTFVGLKLGSS